MSNTGLQFDIDLLNASNAAYQPIGQRKVNEQSPIIDFDNTTTSTEGSIWIMPNGDGKRDMIIGFRGSQQLRDWARDFFPFKRMTRFLDNFWKSKIYILDDFLTFYPLLFMLFFVNMLVSRAGLDISTTFMGTVLPGWFVILTVLMGLIIFLYFLYYLVHQPKRIFWGDEHGWSYFHSLDHDGYIYWYALIFVLLKVKLDISNSIINQLLIQTYVPLEPTTNGLRLFDILISIPVFVLFFYLGFFATRSHVGFLHGYVSVRRAILDTVAANINDVNTIKITGHSLGGALAVICAFDIRKHYPDVADVPIHLETYGSPRVGNWKFKHDFPKSIVFYRFVDDMDMVPRIPPTIMNYTHTRDELTIGTNQGKFGFLSSIFRFLPIGEDMTDHLLSSYRKALESKQLSSARKFGIFIDRIIGTLLAVIVIGAIILYKL